MKLNVSPLIIRKAALACVVLLAASWGQAAVFLNENFDSYIDQSAFTNAWPALNGTTVTPSTVLNNTQSVSPSQSVEGLLTATRNQRSVGEVGFLNGSTDLVI